MTYVKTSALYRGLDAVLSATSGEPTSGVAFNVDPERGFQVTARDDVCLASAMIDDDLDPRTPVLGFVLSREVALALHQFLTPFRTEEKWSAHVTARRVSFFDGLAFSYEPIGESVVTPLYLASLNGGPVNSHWSTLIPETVWRRLRRVQASDPVKISRYAHHVTASFGEWLKVYFTEGPES